LAERPRLGASGIYRTPFLHALDRLAGWSSKLVRAGGLTLVAAGVLGIVASTLFIVAVLRAPEGAFSYAFGGFYMAASLLQGLPRSVLLCAGLAGLYFALEKAPRLVRRMALTGIVSFSLGVVLPLTLLLGQVLGSQDPYGPSSDPLFWEVLFSVFWMSSSVGIALCSVAAFWGRGLGRWRYLLLAVGVLDSPLLYSLVFVVVRGSIEPPVVPYADTRWMEISLQVPVLLASVGWILVGRLLYGARDREAAIVAAEHRALSEENCSKARRLYEVAWGAGDLATINNLATEDILDYEHDRYGREEFKKSVADLRRTFPDLTLSVEEQTAAGDTVTTRCAFSGTDSGGVLWYPPTGKHATFSGTFTDRFSDSRLVEHRGGIGMTGLRAQLGLPRTNEKHQR
jgi:predicted ester cyclase